MTIKALFIVIALIACSSAIDGTLNAQSGSQAKAIAESIEKSKNAKGEGAESARQAMTQLAVDLKSGVKVMKDVGKLTAAYDKVSADGDISKEEAAVVLSQIANLSKPRSGGS